MVVYKLGNNQTRDKVGSQMAVDKVGNNQTRDKVGSQMAVYRVGNNQTRDGRPISQRNEKHTSFYYENHWRC